MRRHIVHLTVLGIPAIHAAGPPDDPPPPLATGAEHQVIHRGDYSMDFRFYRLPDSTLYIKFATAPTSSHMDPRKLERLAAVSTDDGRTWRAEDIVVLRTGTDFRPDSGYPVTIEGTDGTLISVYYLTRGDKTGIELTRWRPAWK